MKKWLGVTLVGIVLLVMVTGCGNSKTKTVTCVSGKIGKSPEIVYYEIYKVKDNEITEVEKYNLRTFDDDYLKLVSLEDTIKIYEKDADTKVEKLSKNKLKVIDTNPTNVFKNYKSDDVVTLIVNSMQKNDFGLYKYTCTVE